MDAVLLDYHIVTVLRDYLIHFANRSANSGTEKDPLIRIMLLSSAYFHWLVSNLTLVTWSETSWISSWWLKLEVPWNSADAGESLSGTSAIQGQHNSLHLCKKGRSQFGDSAHALWHFVSRTMTRVEATVCSVVKNEVKTFAVKTEEVTTMRSMENSLPMVFLRLEVVLHAVKSAYGTLNQFNLLWIPNSPSSIFKYGSAKKKGEAH